VDEAGALLGHHFYIDGAVTRGAGRGRELGVPTANIETQNELVPPHGVYATTATLNGVVLPSVTNIGSRPTFENAGRTVIETHILNFSEDVYEKPLRLGFVQRMRDERRFPDVDALKAQIEADVRRAGRLFDRLSV
jgi:riboflavin kinase/FMN adenylyltransferase